MENRSLTYMLFSFQGRMSRSEYWLRYTIPLLLLYVVMFVLVIVLSLVFGVCLLYTSPSPRDKRQSRMPSSA